VLGWTFAMSAPVQPVMMGFGMFAMTAPPPAPLVLSNVVTSAYVPLLIDNPDGQVIGAVGARAFADCLDLSVVSFPDTVTVFGEEAFMGCSNLFSITLPAGLSVIGDRAFSGCASLTAVTVPAGVSQIGEGVFNLCPALTRVTFEGAYPSGGVGQDIYGGSLSVVTYVRPKHAQSWAEQLDNGSFDDDTAVWQGRPIRILNPRLGTVLFVH